MTNIEDVLAQLPKDMRSRMKFAQEVTTERQPVPSLAMTTELGGGFGYGRTVVIHGSKSAGKSSFCLQMIGDAQRAGKTCAWVDAEKSYDSAWAERLGVDNEQLIISRATDMHRAGDEVSTLVKAGADLIVVDSIGALLQPSYLESPDELAGMSKTSKIGDFSKSLKALLRMVNFVNDDALIVLISQQTTEINQTYTRLRPEGGKAIEYYASQSIKLQSSNSSNNTITQKVASGDKLIDRPVGRKVNWEIEFNKLGPQGATGTYDFYYLGDNVGVDTNIELIKLSLERGIMTKGGAWYKYGEDQKWHGEQALVEELRDNEELRKELVSAIGDF